MGHYGTEFDMPSINIMPHIFKTKIQYIFHLVATIVFHVTKVSSLTEAANKLRPIAIIKLNMFLVLPLA
jgi:hypothetical protein